MPLTDPAHRHQWPRLLMAADPAEVRKLAARLTATLMVEDLQLPQSGLALIQLEDGALGDAWFLGEAPLSRARVRVSGAEGAAQILDDRVDLARCIAIFDAIIAGRLDGYQHAEALLAAGAAAIDSLNAERGALLAATRVDFSLIGPEE